MFHRSLTPRSNSQHLRQVRAPFRRLLVILINQHRCTCLSSHPPPPFVPNCHSHHCTKYSVVSHGFIRWQRACFDAFLPGDTKHVVLHIVICLALSDTQIVGLTGSPVEPQLLQKNLNGHLLTAATREAVRSSVPVADIDHPRCVGNIYGCMNRDCEWVVSGSSSRIGQRHRSNGGHCPGGRSSVLPRCWMLCNH